MLYIAHPYWSDHETVRKERAACVKEAVKELIRHHKMFCLSPVLLGTVVDEAEAFGREYWLTFSMRLLARCDTGILVLPLIGWDKSEGLQREIFTARGLGLTIFSPAQFKLPHPGAGLATTAWHGGPEFVEVVNK